MTNLDANRATEDTEAPATRGNGKEPVAEQPAPQPGAPESWDLDDPALYLNRELSWLNFNFRVLHEAEDESTPLLERVKFLAIVSSNLDEFFMKRIGGLMQQVAAGLQERTVDGRTPAQQISECHALLRELDRRRAQAMRNLIEPLAEAGIDLTEFEKLDAKDQEEFRQYYLESIHPLVTPQATDPAHPFPFISNLSLNLLVELRYPKETISSLARVKIPLGVGVPRILSLPGRRVFIRLEDLIAHNLDRLFPGMDIIGHSLFRVTRNANTERDEEHADDLLALIETELRDRKFAPVVRLEVSRSMSDYHRAMLAAELGLDEQADVFEVAGLVAMRDLMELAALPDPEHHDAPHHPVDHPELTPGRSIFHVIRDARTILLHHPYVSFTTSVERFLREASRDPKVRAVKMTLYRTSADTKAIGYLLDAARNGKQVAVAVELKARFDEAANIRWASRLEEVGIHVTYGVLGLKTHCKTVLVVRQDYDGLRRYAHVGTGNYHAGTARMYSDVGILTSDDAIGRDLTELMNYLTTGYRPKRTYEKILPAPKVLKTALLQRIQREVELHSAESPGKIQIKTNALEDKELVRALYRAGQAGVSVDLIVRDSCRLRPGIPGLSENIKVVSIVGRFLEHARIYYFQNGGEEEYYIGSADCMKRNLDSRVEVLAPVEGANREELRFILDAQLGMDSRGAWEMLADGSYELRRPAGDEAPRSAQGILIDWHTKRLKKASRLRLRKPRGPDRRNLRTPGGGSR